MAIQISEKMPDVAPVRSTDGSTVRLADIGGAVLVVIFSCNHCPYVKAYEGRYIALQKKFKDRDVRVVAVNSNDAQKYPEDSFEKMIERAAERGYNFSYLFDETQAVAHAFGATNTPHVFLFDKDRILRYKGRIDDCWDDESMVRERDLESAVESLLKGEEPAVTSTLPVGCSVKWK